MDDAARSTLDLAAANLLRLLDRHCGDMVAGFHVVGSAADDDFRPGNSDLDFVAVLSRMPGDRDLEALTILHRAYASDPTLPRLDGIWVTRDELMAGPDAIGDGPTSHDGEFSDLARGNRNPITWFSLPRGIALIGTLDGIDLWQDQARLRAWVRRNADEYWRPWLRRASGLNPLMLGRMAPMWGVLGISRQLYTVHTGRIASKTQAGEWALEHFGDRRWNPILSEALAARQGRPSPYGNPLARRRDALTYVAMAIEAVAAA